MAAAQEPTKAGDSVPGPASLLANAIDQPDVSPLVARPEDSAAESTAESTNTSGATTPDSARRSSKPTVTTTITTVSEPSEGNQGSVKTETFTHVGTSIVSAKVSCSDGSVTLRPIPARGTLSSQIKTRRTRSTFQPRISHFDRNNSISAQDPFRGFYTLFWIFIAVAAAQTGVRHYSQEGVVWGTQFVRLISRDGWILALSDGVMVCCTFLCVPFVQMLNRGWLRYWGAGAIIQHTLQTLYLALAVRWTFHRDWPWVQSGFLVLHTLTMLMKVHSYCSYNGELSEKARELKQKETALEEVLFKFGGRLKVQAEARAAWEKAVAASEGETGSAVLDASSDTKPRDFAPSDHSTLHRRRSRRQSSDKRSPSTPRVKDVPSEGLEVLTWHSEEQISKLAIAMADLNDALVSTGVAQIRYPDNITYANFIDYLLVPTLVYHLEYPRTKTIRPLYVLEKVLATFGTFSILVLIVEHYIIPVQPSDGDSFFTSLLDLAMPFMLNYLLIFYIIFECILNAFAEITRFADREFYQDWWNSTSFDEFSRRWNVPVHSFLLRHVYTSTMTTYRFSKFQAAFVTFLLSACVHELVMAVAMKKVRLYLFVLQMAQLPLIMVGRLPIFRAYPALGNLFFWIGLLSGFPLLAVCYMRF